MKSKFVPHKNDVNTGATILQKVVNMVYDINKDMKVDKIHAYVGL